MINHTILQGRLTADPEVKKTPSDVPYTGFTVAWSEKHKETETSCFLRCTAWRHTAEFIGKYFKKGQEIAVEGKLTTRSYDKDGVKHSVTELTVDSAHFCGSKSNGSQDASGASTGTYKADETKFKEANDDDDLPF